MQFNEGDVDTLCKFWQIGELVGQPEVIKSQRIWKITTEQDVFALKRIDLNKQALNNVNQGEQIARHLLQYKLPVIVALAAQEQVVCQIEDSGYMLFPWQEGTVLPLTAASPEQAFLIGKLLAEIHVVNLNLPKVSLSAWQNFQAVNWRELAQSKLWPAAIADRLRLMLPKLYEWSDNYLAACEKLVEPWVISHGDLTQSNIIWSEQTRPWLIDWDAAGWIHPHVELLGVALNWSGINCGMPVLDSFAAVINGYQQVMGPSQMSATVLQVGLGSWLAWLEFMMQNFLKTKQIDACDEIIQTLNVLERFANLPAYFSTIFKP